MKKLILTAAVLMGVSSVSRSIANDAIKIVNVAGTTASGDLSIRSLSGLKFKVTFDKIQGKSFLEIRDAQNELLHKEYMNGDGDSFAKIYDLSSFPDGSYTFTLTSRKESVAKKISIVSESKRTVITE